MLTLMTYNLKDGGRDRVDALLAVIGAHRPDVLAVQELGQVYRRPGRLLSRIAADTGMTGHLARSRFGQAVAVLLRRPTVILSRGRVHRPMHHAAARVTLATRSGPLTVASAHLQATSPGRRLREARRVVARPAAGLTVVMGDLNTLDPRTDHTAALADLPVRYRRRHLTRGQVDTRPIQALTDAGLVDLYASVGRGASASVPTALGGREFPVARLDYILGTAPVAALTHGCQVVRDPSTDTASDHYPLIATVDLELHHQAATP